MRSETRSPAAANAAGKGSRRMLIVTVFVGSLLLLRASILWIDMHLDLRHEQKALITAQDIDPAALFYTEIPAARAAEKRVRALLAEEPVHGEQP